MSRTNYRDLSKAGSDLGAGFQFEFYCNNCSRTWKSAYKPYRRGQLAALIYKFAYLFDKHGQASRASGAISDVGMKAARGAALEEAIEESSSRYIDCPGCEKTVCEECWNPSAKLCEGCITHGAGGHARGTSSSPAGGATCPNCRALLDGGRFCPDCGFDMASTHKACPSCGVMCARSARFCTDCGHAF